MALYIMQGNLDADEPVSPPTKTKYAMSFENGTKIAFADSFLELMVAMVPGYAAVGEEIQMELRYSLGATLAPLIQANALDIELPESIQGAMLDLHAQWIANTASEDDLLSWRSSGPVAPLVGICRKISSHVHSDHEEEASDYWWICPATEESLLRSLHSFGIVRLMVAESQQ